MVPLKRLPAAFYATAGGREPVREWLKTLGRDDRRRVGEDIATAEFGWPLGMPLCRPNCGMMGRGLFEIRSNLSDGRISRVIFAVTGERMVLLHAFVKKSRKTPKADLDLAVRRLQEIGT